MSNQNPSDNTPGSADALLPVVGMNGAQGFENVQIRGNRLDNHTESLSQARQIISYRARFSDTFSDAVLWCCASGAISRALLLMVRSGNIPPIYPLGIGLGVVIIGGIIFLDTVKRYPALAPAAGLRGLYVVFGLLSTAL